MGRAGIALALIVGVLTALYIAPAFLKASDQLRNYRPDPFRTIETRDGESAGGLGVGGSPFGQQSRRHATGTRPDHGEITVFHARSFVMEEQRSGEQS